MILPHNIDLAQSQKYNLSIRLTPNGFSFFIFSPKNKTAFFYKDVEINNTFTYIENIKRIFFEVNLFTQPYKKTYITVVSPKYTTVPNRFYDKSKQKELFEFNFNDNSGELFSTYLESHKIHLLYDIDKEIYSFLFRNLWNPAVENFVTYLFEAFVDYQTEKFKKRCFVDFHDNMATIICFNNKDLLMAKTFSAENQYEDIYNIINIWEKLKLNQNQDALFLSGNTDAYKYSTSTLKQLIKNVSAPNIFKKPEQTSENNNYLPTDILSQICG